MDNKEELKEQIEEKKKEIKEETKEVEPPKEVEPKSTGIRSSIKELNEKMNLIVDAKTSKSKKKEFKLPRKVKSKLKKLAKKGKVQVMLCQPNKNIKPTIGEIKEGMLIVGDKIYDASPDGIWLWNGKIPTSIVMESDIKPLTAEGMHRQAVQEGSVSYPQTIMIRAMELKEALGTSKKLGGKAVIWIVIAAVAGIYILFSNQGG